MVYGKDVFMSLKILGAILIVVGCGGFGFCMAAQHNREERVLREFVGVLDYMECELQYRLTPLPDLCRQSAAQCRGILREVMLKLTQELEDQVSPNVEHCVSASIGKVKHIPKNTVLMLETLGRSLGRFDLDGQLRGFEAVRKESRRLLERLTTNKDARLRSYQTLGLCAGAALAILFV